MREDAQLTFDGAEVPHRIVVEQPAPSRDLNPFQRDVLRTIADEGWVSPKAVGLLLYAHQGTPWRAPYASADGSEVLRRLAMRGLVHREQRGRWVLGPPAEPVRRRRSEQRRAS